MSYTCPTCKLKYEHFKPAGLCCQSDFVECPLSELPPDAEFGGGPGHYSYGTVFTGRWELVLNGSPSHEPVRVYPLPPLISKMISTLADARYAQGVTNAQAEMRRAFGMS